MMKIHYIIEYKLINRSTFSNTIVRNMIMTKGNPSNYQNLGIVLHTVISIIELHMDLCEIYRFINLITIYILINSSLLKITSLLTIV